MPANDPFQQDRQKEFQARITALLLGEYNGSVAAELCEAIDADPVLIKLRDRLEKTIGLLGETTQPAESLPLDEDRRAALLAQFKTPVPETTADEAVPEQQDLKPEPGRPTPIRQFLKWARPIGLAASLIGLLTVAAVSFLTFTGPERATVQVRSGLRFAEEIDRESVEVEKGWAEALPMKSETLDTDSFKGFEFDSFSVNEDTESGTINVKSIGNRDSTTQPNPHYLTGSVKPAGMATGKSKPALAESVSFGVSPLSIEDLASVDLQFPDPGPFVPQAQSVDPGVIGVPLSEILNLRRTKQSISIEGKKTAEVPALPGDLPLMGRLFRSEGKRIARQSKESVSDVVTVEAEFAKRLRNQVGAGGVLQSDQVKAAEEEALRRQETTVVLKQNLAKAKGFENDGDHEAAATLYEESTRLVDRLGGVNVEAEYRAAIAGLANSRYAISKAMFEQRKFPEAVDQMDQLLKFDPKSQTGAQYKDYVNQTAAKHVGRSVSEETPDKIPASLANKKEVAGIIQDGKFLYEMRLLGEAKKKLRQAIELDPAAKSAYYYLSLVQEAEYGDEVRKRDAMQKERLVEVARSWNEGLPLKSEALPTPNPYFRTNKVNTSSRRRSELLRKLNTITLNDLSSDDLTLGEVVSKLDEEVRKQDPEGKGVNFIINPFLDELSPTPGEDKSLDAFGQPITIDDAAQANDLKNVKIKIDSPLRDLPLIDALDAIAKTADTPIKFTVEDYAVVFGRDNKPVPPLERRVFKVDPTTFIKGLESVAGLDIAQFAAGGGDGSGSGFTIPRVSVTDNGRATNGIGGIRFVTQTNSVADSTRLVRQFFAASGVTFTNGTQVFFNDRNGVLMVKATPQDFEIIQNAVEILSPPKPKAPEPKPEPEPAPPAKPAPTPRAKPNPEVQAKDNPFSNFSLNVSDVSFKLAAASLEKGALPDPATIRSEEFVNAFDYRDPAPTGDAKLAFAFEQARDPFAHNRNLMRFAVQTAAFGREPGRPLNLVVLLDNSGSMERPDRVAIVREALRVLSGQLTAADCVSVVAFARTPRLCVDGLPGNQSEVLLSRVLDLNPQGGTNLEAALNAAYATAQKHFRENGNNRVILFTDGAANLGDIKPEALKQKVESFRAKGVALDCFGIGWDGYNDDLMETLSRNGDGRYGFLNHPAKVAVEFADQLAGSLRVAASNVKAQIEFNPARVVSWRQIGYEKHQLKKEQFRDNKVDAAEIGAAESGTALYSIQADPKGSGPIGVARIRFMNPATGRYEEQSWPLAYNRNSPTLDQAAPSIRLAACAAAFAEWLARSPYAAEVTPDALLGYLNEAVKNYALDARPRQLQSMIQHARLTGGQ